MTMQSTEDWLACAVPSVTVIRSWLHMEKNQKQELKYQRESLPLFHWSTVHWFHRTISLFLLKKIMIQSWQMEASLTVTLFPQHVLNNNLCNRNFHCYLFLLCSGNSSACLSLTCFLKILGVCWKEGGNTANDRIFFNQAECISSYLSI